MKRGFKNSAVGEIPDDWEVKPIGQIATVVRGASPRPKGDPRYYGGSVPRLMGTDVTRDGKYVTPNKDFLTEEGAALSRFMKAGTLVMICSGDVGVPTILAVDACVHDGFLAFPEISDQCELEFLYYVFDSLHDKFNSSATHGGVFTNLTTTIVKDFLIPIPPFSEQQKISGILRVVDEKIRIIEGRIEQTQRFKRGLLQKLLSQGIGHTKFKASELGSIPDSWQIKDLRELAKTTVGIASSATHAYTKKGILLIRNQNIKEGKLDLKDVLFVNEDYELQHKTKRLKAGDILTVRTGYPGISAIVPKELEGSQSFTTLITRITTNIVKNDFLCLYINSDKGKLFFKNNQAGGGQQNVGSKTLESLKVPIPPLIEQRKITDFLGTISEKLEVLQSRKDFFQELKKGLMQTLLTGRIKVKLS